MNSKFQKIIEGLSQINFKEKFLNCFNKFKNLGRGKKITIIIVLFIILSFFYKTTISFFNNFGARKYGNLVILYPIYFETFENGQIHSYNGFINSKGVLAKPSLIVRLFTPVFKKNLLTFNGPFPFFDYRESNKSYFRKIEIINNYKKALTDKRINSILKENYKNHITSETESLNNDLKHINEEYRRYQYGKGYITVSQLPSAINDVNLLYKTETGVTLDCDKQYCGIKNEKGNFIIPRSYAKPAFELPITTPYISNHFYGDNSYFIGGYYFDLNGQKFFEKEFDVENSLPFVEGLAWVYETKAVSTNPKKMEVIKVGYINKKGKYVWSYTPRKDAPIYWENKL